MIQPVPVSWSDYARSAAESRHPRLWDRLVFSFAPHLGATGKKLLDLSPRRRHGETWTALDESNWLTDRGLVGLNWPDRATERLIATPTIAHNVGTGDFTFVFLLSTVPGGETQGLLMGGAGPQIYPYRLGAPAIYWDGWCQFTLPVTSGVRYSLALVRRAGTLYCYLDGVEDATTYANSNSFTSDAWTFGKTGGSYRFIGTLHAAQMWARGLEPAEILTLARDPFAMVRSRRRRFFPAAAAVGNVYEEGCLFGMTGAMSAGAAADFAVGTSFAANAAVGSGALADLQAAVALGAQSALATATSADFQAALALAVSSQYAAASSVDAVVAASFATAAQMAAAGQLDAYDQAALAAQAGLAAGAALSTSDALAFAAQSSLTVAGGQVAELALAFAAESAMGTGASLAFAEQFVLAARAEIDVLATAYCEAFLTLGGRAGLTASVAGYAYQVALTFSVLSSLASKGQLDVNIVKLMLESLAKPRLSGEALSVPTFTGETLDN